MYGRAKLAGERFVREIAPESFVVRVGHVYGGGNDYLSAHRAPAGRWRDGRWASPIGGARPPTSATSPSASCRSCLTGRFGLYHLGGPEPASWFEVLHTRAGLAGFGGSVEPQRAAELGLPAPRPVYSALTSVFTPHLGIDPMPLAGRRPEGLPGVALDRV